jgi:glyoxylase-like metal-dependent hydrolase (beta-lactamase superfamily II)
MILEARSVPPFHKNGFVAACPRTREAVVIDPGDEVAELAAVVRDQGLSVRHILLTHAHVDHVTGVASAKRAFASPVWLHADDLPLYNLAVQQGLMFGLQVTPPPPVDEFYGPTPLRFGDYGVLIHHTPGHCPGGVCLQVDDPTGDPARSASGGDADAQPARHLFVGDTLFAGSIGRTDLPGGNYDVLMRSIVNVLFPLGDRSIVHPGHGPDTTIGRERVGNPFVLEYLTR